MLAPGRVSDWNEIPPQLRIVTPLNAMCGTQLQRFYLSTRQSSDDGGRSTQSIFNDYYATISQGHQYYAPAFCFSLVLHQSESNMAGELMI